MTSLRTALAVALLAGFYLVGLGALAVLAWLSVWLWLTYPGEFAQDASYVVAATAVGLVVPVWRVLRARPQPPAGSPVTVEHAPQLWSVVHELADLVGTRAPDEIRLVAVVNAAVWEDAGLMGLRAGRRYLYVGVPILQVLTVSQIRAVLAHELGHYSRGHTRFGALTYRGSQSIVATITQVGPRRLTGRLLTGYAAVYFLVALAVMRRMEAEADRAAVQAAGREATTLALREMHRLNVAWESYLDGYVSWAKRIEYAPSEVLGHFRSLVEQRSHHLRRVPARVAREKPSPWDPHPPIEERIALVDCAVDVPVAADLRPGLVLIDDVGTLSAALQSAEFDEHVEAIAHEDARRDAEALYYAATKVAGTRRAGLGTVLDLLADGRAGAVRPELRRAAQSEGTSGSAEQLTGLVLAAVNATLVNWCAARWRHSWTAPMALVSTNGNPITLRPTVTAACADPHAVPQLRTLLHELGIGERATTDSPSGWREPLDIGTVHHTVPGTEPSQNTELLLPDELFLLAYQQSGRCRIDSDILAAGLAAATLAELRLRARVELADTDEAVLRVCDRTPTGDRFLDSVLGRLAAADPHPAYQWLQMLGPDVADAVRRRRKTLFGVFSYDRAGKYVFNVATGVADAMDKARAGIVQAIHTGDVDGRDLALGVLLWGTELTAPVLGRRSLWLRFWLGRAARRDRLAVAIRTVIGLHMPVPATGSGGAGS